MSQARRQRQRNTICPAACRHLADLPGFAAQPLGQPTYDGAGFFAHLAETGTDPWQVTDRVGDADQAGGSR